MSILYSGSHGLMGGVWTSLRVKYPAAVGGVQTLVLASGGNSKGHGFVPSRSQHHGFPSCQASPRCLPKQGRILPTGPHARLVGDAEPKFLCPAVVFKVSNPIAPTHLFSLQSVLSISPHFLSSYPPQRVVDPLFIPPPTPFLVYIPRLSSPCLLRRSNP